MADLDILPTWAVNYLRDTLSDHLHIVNAIPVDKGRLRGAFLVNSNRGAVLLYKGRVGEPQHWFLPVPARHVTFTCHVCQERMDFVDPEVPRTVYCTSCGTRYTMLLDHGDVVLRRDEIKRAPAEAPKPAAKEAPAPVPEPAPAEPPAPSAPTPDVPGPFTHKGYTLYERQTKTKGGGETTFYFFAKNTPKSGAPTQKPDGYSVEVNARTGLPYLRRTDKKQAAPKVQCGALTADGKQCRRTARSGSKYCHAHKGYHPRTESGARSRLDTAPTGRSVKDSLPGEGTRTAGDVQCAALTAGGKQCKNTSRAGSKYCHTHKGHRPRTAGKATDTKPVGRGVEDTQIVIRRG